MKQFTMSMYPSYTYLLESKVSFYQALCEQLLEQLEMAETVAKDCYGEWYWTATGDSVGDDL